MSKKKLGQTIGFVPTMGALHDGHLSLVRHAKKNSDVVVVSIFVNPIQFGPKEDYKKYPRDIKSDSKKLQNEGVDILFLPGASEMYPDGFDSYVEVKTIGDVLCGKSRPGHFKGVTTIVAKLFNIVLPDFAYFGAKDFQQQAIIKKMVEDLNFPVKIITVPTVRQSNGLAMSSRNTYLTSKEETAAVLISQSLLKAKKAASNGCSSSKLIRVINKELSREPMIRVDYISVVSPDDLHELKTVSGYAVIAVAVFIGRTRLIDNISIDC